jgi:putative lipase involved disintegration of autophagic bodies
VDSQYRSLVSVIACLACGLQNLHFGGNSHGIIFTATKEMARKMEEEMSCFVHFSDKDKANQRRLNSINLAEWQEGHQQDREGVQIHEPWLAATPGLINGIDMDCIDAVIFGDEGRAGLSGGVQGTGQGGQSGQPCICIFVTTGTFNASNDNINLSCMDEMKCWTQEEMCRCIVPSEIMDGN